MGAGQVQRGRGGEEPAKEGAARSQRARLRSLQAGRARRSLPGRAAQERAGERAQVRLALALLLSSSAASAWEAHTAPDGQYFRWSFAHGGPVIVKLVTPPLNLRLKPGSDLRAALI